MKVYLRVVYYAAMEKLPRLRNWVVLGVALSSCCVSIADEVTASEETLRIYNQTCVACHATGVRGAPRPGVSTDWEDSLSYGREDIYLNSIEGVGEMPPRGMCADCTNEQIRAVVDYMLTGVE
ncbi:MAG TPA: cytochrome c5 family protein [Gammaproteobacteria bacterium]|nr:cytochrome c5 family protein [Gammaproteobacteria bacterium]HIL95070.1 cytochrome c5 family protein [Pseudomonadales bacterium]